MPDALHWCEGVRAMQHPAGGLETSCATFIQDSGTIHVLSMPPKACLHVMIMSVHVFCRLRPRAAARKRRRLQLRQCGACTMATTKAGGSLRMMRMMLQTLR